MFSGNRVGGIFACNRLIRLSCSTPLSRLFTSTTYADVTYPLFADAANLILRSNTEGNAVCLFDPVPAAFSTIVDQTGRMSHADGNTVLLHFLAGSTGIAEGLYFPNIEA